MFQVKLPDNSIKSFDKPITGEELAKSISSNLAKDAIAIKVNDSLIDLNIVLENNASVEIITKNSKEGLQILRHDVAHLFAQSIKELFPDTQITIGPAIENGFYYDIYNKNPLSINDFEKIENKMKELVQKDIPIQRHIWKRDDAIKFFKKINEDFKVEIIEQIPQDQVISFYQQGDFVDLCKGPHSTSTKKIGIHFKLMKIAGAYWRGDSNNVMLQRIYGTAFASKKDLDDYLYQLEEAEKRDHRKLGQAMNLFHLQDEAIGSVFWHPKGWTIYKILENYIRSCLEEDGYDEVKTPQLLDKSLWEASGHWEQYKDNMYTVNTDDEKTLAIKPMNCPCHIQIFKQGIKSYKDLPIRMAEFGSCHRNEPSGSLHGIMRVRSFTQDDAHIFCTKEQIVDETKKFCDLLIKVYKKLGFEDFYVKFSDRPQKRAGSDDIWDQAEQALMDASKKANLDFTINKGEGAFYGPKLEFVLKDSIGREWQCGTLQVDFVLPERLDANYIAADGQKYRPVMLHRAILGSFERFIGVLIEHYAGKLPLWLCPIQVVVANITTESIDYANEVFAILKQNKIRAQIDIRNEKISYKIREHSLQKVPYIFVLGKQELQNKTITIRTLGSDTQKTISLDEVLSLFQ